MLEYGYDKTTDNQEVDNMENKKVIETIEKKLEVTVEKVYEIKQEGKMVMADVKVGENNYRKIQLKEMRNQYGPYYKIMSVDKYTRKRAVEQKTTEKKPDGKLKTKTERLCSARRKDIIRFAEQNIESLSNGTATFKEIEGAAKEDTVIRFVLILNADGTRFKEDIEISKIRDGLAV